MESAVEVPTNSSTESKVNIHQAPGLGVTVATAIFIKVFFDNDTITISEYLNTSVLSTTPSDPEPVKKQLSHSELSPVENHV